MFFVFFVVGKGGVLRRPCEQCQQQKGQRDEADDGEASRRLFCRRELSKIMFLAVAVSPVRAGFLRQGGRAGRRPLSIHVRFGPGRRNDGRRPACRRRRPVRRRVRWRWLWQSLRFGGEGRLFKQTDGAVPEDGFCRPQAGAPFLTGLCSNVQDHFFCANAGQWDVFSGCGVRLRGDDNRFRQEEVLC